MLLLAGLGAVLCDPEQIAGRILEQRKGDHFRDDGPRQHNTPAVGFDLGKNFIDVVNAHIEHLVGWIFTDAAAEPACGTRGYRRRSIDLPSKHALEERPKVRAWWKRGLDAPKSSPDRPGDDGELGGVGIIRASRNVTQALHHLQSGVRELVLDL